MSSSSQVITSNDLPLRLIAKGKVRDVYDAGITQGPHAGAILFVATDRISAFDIILENGIPNKGKLLHALSTFWFELLTPSLIDSHVIAAHYDDFPSELQQKLEAVREQVQGRSMLVKKAKVLPIEAIVRGYITGSGWAEYKKSGTVHGIQLPEGLVESQQIPGGPIFTPSTKADQGEHDENIHPDKANDIIGKDLAQQMAQAAVALYSKAADHARSRGIILADTKFEFGLVADENGTDKMILVDEVLTPDSSRFWSAKDYQQGSSPNSFDKQYVRDWLKSKRLDKAGDEGIAVTLPDDVVQATEQKYREAYELITGSKYEL